MKKLLIVLLTALSANGIAAAEAQGTGVVKSVDSGTRVVVIAHEPIPALKWPKMTMDFKVKDPKTLDGIKPGQTVKFDLDKDPATGYVISRIEAAGK